MGTLRNLANNSAKMYVPMKNETIMTIDQKILWEEIMIDVKLLYK